MKDVFAHPSDAEAAAVILAIMMVVVIAIIVLLMAILFTWSFCRIFKKAGYSWAWGLLWLVPIGNIVAILMLAFGDWPIHKEIQNLKSPAPDRQGGGSNPTAV
jgi:heme/copper-type cytochrome/quinol oxidase subunit 2